ncbi:hypothetical protein EWM64_g1345 [Hericium alpestre]|uniref:RRN6 K-rich C-terminal domain-containing protein n=1 Tax=Hericium alpestre TaxID=135208 RepID=A0A4Z0A8M3_9AGAM|nr:hypothetical protein EWM64_g1345 [Hericium alpestre]
MYLYCKGQSRQSSHPDVDIPSELIRDVVVSEAEYSASLSDFDPYIGDQMASLYCLDKRHKHAFLAFPTGEVASDLNMSELLFPKTSGARLVPNLRPIRQFETPILQIATFPPFSDGFDRSPVLAIRTYASTSFFSVALNQGSTSAASRLGVSELACHQTSDLGGRAVVDVQLSSSPRRATLVDNQEHKCGICINDECRQMIRKPEDFAGGPEDTFWRLALSDDSREYFLASSKNIMNTDFREPSQGTALYKIWSSQDLLTSIDFISDEGLLQVATTSELLWLDKRYPGRAVLAIKHGREFDRTLQLRTAHVRNRLFMNTDPEKGIRPPENAEAVYDTLERMSSYLQEANSPKEHMLTTFDIAFRSGDEPLQASRADFLTQSNLSNKRGYRALMQDRIPMDNLRKQVPWQSDVTPFLRRFSNDIADKPQDISDRLTSHNLNMDDYRPGPSIRRETEAREQLTLDLALSTTVFSPQPFSHSRPHEPDGDLLDNVSRATEAMSLGAAELPELQFGFLSPTFKDHYKNQDDGGPRQFATPSGVRLLLKEWDVGSDPDAYEYHDPYSSEESAAVPPRPTKAPTPMRRNIHTSGAVQSQRPPVIASSQVPPAVASKPPMKPFDLQKHPSQERIRRMPIVMNVQSQDAPAEPATQFSQEFMASTQVVAGPYGGRQGFTKKPQKKRLGGF